MPIQNSTPPVSCSNPINRAAQGALPAAMPAFAFLAALAVMAMFAPESVAAQSNSQSDSPSYVNTQFMEEREEEESGRLVISNTSILPRTVYARFQMPGDPDNRNYGFFQTIAPLSKIAYDLPTGVRVFACDGKYWDSYRPDEALAVTITKADTYQFTHSEFKPMALRRSR